MCLLNSYYPNEPRDLSTWYTIHNDGNNQWIVFEYEWVLSRKLTPDVKKQHVTKPDNNGEHKTV